MAVRETSCPGCGNTLTFRNAASVYIICEYCKSASYRKDLNFELVGKVASVAEIDSPFELGARGQMKTDSWYITGQLQFDHGKGPWNEWCITLGSGKTAWLAEAQGEYLVSEELTEVIILPKRLKLQLGQEIQLGSKGRFVVAEIGTGHATAARGELPELIKLNDLFTYADLRGEGDGFATLDYGAGDTCEAVYVGRSLTLEQLGFDAASAPRKNYKRIDAGRIACPNCGASVEIRDPANTKRVGCESCSAILDPTNEQISAVNADKKYKTTPEIPLGAVGKLKDQNFTVLAFMVRSVQVEGTRYPWNEYLLKRADGAYRWLVQSSGHWSFVTPVNIANVKTAYKTARYEGRKYKFFQNGMARVDQVFGEVYWEVEVGEKALTNDYICPPYMISTELTDNETIASFGEYVEPEEITKAFNIKKALSPRKGIGTQQPNPHQTKGAWIIAGALSAIIIILSVYFHIRASNRLLFSGDLTYQQQSIAGVPAAAPNDPAGNPSIVFTDEFDILPSSSNIHIRLKSKNLNNSWLGVDGALVDVVNGDVYNFYSEVSYWTGKDSDGAWTDDNSTDNTYIGPIPAGRYALRLDPNSDPATASVLYTIEIRNQVASKGRPIILILLIFIIPVLASLLRASFEGRRWAESSEAD
ncbi:MAG: DUF4178 domain-containing protein [Planctomycetota bacterium]